MGRKPLFKNVPEENRPVFVVGASRPLSPSFSLARKPLKDCNEKDSKVPLTLEKCKKKCEEARLRAAARAAKVGKNQRKEKEKERDKARAVAERIAELEKYRSGYLKGQ